MLKLYTSVNKDEVFEILRNNLNAKTNIDA